MEATEQGLTISFDVIGTKKKTAVRIRGTVRNQFAVEGSWCKGNLHNHLERPGMPDWREGAVDAYRQEGYDFIGGMDHDKIVPVPERSDLLALASRRAGSASVSCRRRPGPAPWCPRIPNEVSWRRCAGSGPMHPRARSCVASTSRRTGSSTYCAHRAWPVTYGRRAPSSAGRPAIRRATTRRASRSSSTSLYTATVYRTVSPSSLKTRADAGHTRALFPYQSSTRRPDGSRSPRTQARPAKRLFVP